MGIPPRQADPERIISNSRTFFVTSTTWGRRSLFQSSAAAELFLKVLFEYRALSKYKLHEFVLMRDHFHLLFTIDSQMTIERALQLIKGGFAHRAGKELRLKNIWQRGFSEERILDRAAYLRQRAYIRNNPVAAGLVERAEDYYFSSAHPGYELDPEPQGLKPHSLEPLYGTAKAVP